MTLMKDYWKMMEPEKPSLCISVIGGAKSFVLDGHKKDVFYSGLVQAALSTKAWIVTSGLNLGIVRMVGKALQDQKFHFDEWKPSESLICLGIAPWGYVLNRQTLVSENHNTPIRYEITDFITRDSPVSLNQNHTHYIFVDEGRRLRYGGSKSAEFRARLEKQIALPVKKGGFGIPVVLVIVEGGHDVFIDAKNSLKEHVPVVICSGTGRAADILSLAFEYRLRNETFNGFSEMELAALKNKLQNISGTPSKVDSAIEMIEFIVQNDRLITTFDMNHSNDLDLAILYSLIKTSSNLDKQLELAFTWKRSDIARDIIFQQGNQFDQVTLEYFMLEALKKDELDFVKIFLYNGVSMNTFLTVDRLSILYNNSVHRDGLIKCLRKHKLLQLSTNIDKNENSTPSIDNSNKKLRLATIGLLLDKMLGSFDNYLYETDADELFIWAVLHQRQEMALYFWELSENGLILALIGCCLYSNMIKSLPSYDTEARALYESYVKEFEELTLNLLDRETYIWGSFNCLRLAAQSLRRKFISSTACQDSLYRAWRGGVHTNAFVILATLIFPFLLFFDCLFRWDNRHTITKESQNLVDSNSSYDPDIKNKRNNSTDSCCGLISKCNTIKSRIQIFYNAPRTKFIFNAICQSCDGKLELLCNQGYGLYWNKSDVCLVFLGLFSASLRIGFSTTFILAKSFYVITLVGCYLKVYSLYSHHPRLGPKLVMVRSMLIELQMFIFILVVVLVSYGVSQQVLLYPYRANFSWRTLRDIFYYPYWNLYGEIMLEYAFAENEGCTATGVLNSECPMSNYLSPLFLAVYLMIAGILLINLLIAIFSNVFEKIEENSIELWKFNIFSIVLEYSNRPVLPVPFSSITAIIKLILYCLRVKVIHSKIQQCCKRTPSADQNDETSSLTSSSKVVITYKENLRLIPDYITNRPKKNVKQYDSVDNDEWPNPRQLENYCKGVLIRRNLLKQSE
uniref:Transient receptor potential cation channel subfamily M member 4 n=1 Tax=Schistosoma haematobium TaxID=6185 RepID=A0A094ZZL1_SCHHA